MMIIAFLLLLFFVSLLRATKPATLEEVNNLATRENLTVIRGDVILDAIDSSIYETFLVRGVLFSCVYQHTYNNRSRTIPHFETIFVNVFPSRGFYSASFRNDYLLSWRTRWRKTLINEDSSYDLHEIWMFQNILASVKNAIEINSEIQSDREAIS
jgi:hypothetical protein